MQVIIITGPMIIRIIFFLFNINPNMPIKNKIIDKFISLNNLLQSLHSSQINEFFCFIKKNKL